MTLPISSLQGDVGILRVIRFFKLFLRSPRFLHPDIANESSTSSLVYIRHASEALDALCVGLFINRLTMIAAIEMSR